jgi:diguanylate cyclase (GGDEF)-like protein
MTQGDRYEGVDLLLTTRLAGALWLVGALYGVVLAPLAPPTALAGEAGWPLLGATALLATLTGLHLVRRRTPLRAGTLLAGAYAALLVVALLATLSGGVHPYAELSLVVATQAAMVHPPGRAAGVLAAASALLAAPLVAGGVTAEHVVEVAGHLALLAGLSGMALAWAGRMRALRLEVVHQREQAVELARVDALTGLGNRRALDEALAAERNVVARTGRPLSLMVCDLDDFKAINDDAGHPEGDAALRCVAGVLRETLRHPDRCFRWGGDEFVALLADTPLEGATGVAARLRRTLPARCRRAGGRRLHVSVGVAELRPGETGADLLERADALLLAAKAQGRGQRFS